MLDFETFSGRLAAAAVRKVPVSGVWLTSAGPPSACEPLLEPLRTDEKGPLGEEPWLLTNHHCSALHCLHVVARNGGAVLTYGLFGVASCAFMAPVV